MTSHARLTVATALTIAILCGCNKDVVAPVDRRADDKAIVAVVLEEFSKRTDGFTFNFGNLLLIQPKTQPWPDRSLEDFGRNPESGCSIPQKFNAAFEAANPIEKDAAPLVPQSTNWRIATKEEVEKGEFIQGATVPGGTVRTILHLSSPGYTANNEAFIVISFKWSMHGGFLRAVLDKKSDRWVLRCSELNMYV